LFKFKLINLFINFIFKNNIGVNYSPLYAKTTGAVIKNCTMNNNVLQNPAYHLGGGAINIDAASNIVGLSVSVTDSTFLGNKAVVPSNSGSGGAIHIDNFSYPYNINFIKVNITNTVFRNNRYVGTMLYHSECVICLKSL